ncbi:MAG: ComF family protein [Pseudomonadota bacterium]
MYESLVKTAKSLSAWLIPHRCLACTAIVSGPNQPFCETCHLALPFQPHSCTRCGQALNAEQDYCGRCIQSPVPFDLCFYPFRYESPISDAIHRFKYGDRPQLAKPLGTVLASEIREHGLPLPEILLPVPMHVSRLRKRGFNQSLQLCKQVATELSIPYSNGVLEKSRATPAQVGLSLRERRASIRDSFRISRNFTKKSVAVIDDVITTGSTVEEIAKILKRNGVNYVYIWGLAHTI